MAEITDTPDVLSGCDICGENHTTELCPELGLNSNAVQLYQLSTKARLTLPSFVEVIDDGQGFVGVVAKMEIPAKHQFGPFEAKRTTHVFDDTGFFTLKVIGKDGTTICLDTTDESECNWLCLIRAATTPEDRNCIAYQIGNNIYYHTTRDINVYEELLVWYAPHFAKKLGKPPEPDGVSRVLLGHRIEPLTSDILSSEHTPVDPVDKTEPDPEAENTGEAATVKKGFYCPRCGNTFQSRTEMVQHLREHVAVQNGMFKRGKGRPRKDGQHSKVYVSQVLKRGRGRPRKVVSNSDEQDDDLRVKPPTKDYSRKRKADDNDDDDADDADDDLADIADIYNDHEYTPRKEVDVQGRRVQPRRSTRNQNSRFKEYEVAYSAKKGKKEITVGTELTLKQGAQNCEVKPVNDAVKYKDQMLVTPKVLKAKTVRAEKAHITSSTDSNVKIPSDFGEITESNVNVESNDGEISIGNVKISEDNEEMSLESDAIADKGITGGNTGKTAETTLETDTVNEKNIIEEVQGSDTSENHNDDDLTKEIKSDRGDNKENDAAINAESGGLSSSQGLATETSSVEMETNTRTVDLESQIKTKMVELATESDPSPVEMETKSSAAKSVESTHESNKNEDERDPSNKELPEIETHEIGDISPNEELHAVKVRDSTPSVNASTSVSSKESSAPSSTSISTQVSTADKGSMVVMFEVIEDGKFSCVLCSEMFVEESVAVAHFMVHEASDIKCRNCNKLFQSVEELMEHRAQCSLSPAVQKPTPDKHTGTYACDICQQAFKTPQYLFRHMVMHTDVFKCEKCEKTFSRKDSMHKHVLKCCPELAAKYKIYYCEICMRVFSTESGRQRHSQKCKSVQCEKCQKIFSSEKDMVLHFCQNREFSDTATFSCGRCSKTFQSLYYLKQHQSLHDTNHACNQCGKNFNSPEELNSHITVCETLEGIRLFGSGMCPLCKETFSNSRMFKAHYLTHTHPYHCEKCDKRFLRVFSLNSHICDENGWVCDVCHRSFKHKANLEKHQNESGCMKYQCSVCNEQFHLKTHANNHRCIVEAAEEVEAQIVSKKPTQEVCEFCGKTFSNKSNLSKHMILHGEKKLACPHCDKRFHLDVYLREHIACVHFKIFKYQCNECGRMLKSKTGLIAHNRIFHAKNPETYPCTKCGKVFKQKGNLRTHMFSHSTERKFKCELCVRAFKYPDQLSRHKIEHKVVPKLKCTHCDKDFLHGYMLKKHFQIYHSGYIYVCGICSARCGHRHTLVRHYKRKHPESVHLTRKTEYLDGLLMHVGEAELPPDLIPRPPQRKKTYEDILKHVEILPEDAAEALHKLSIGQATAEQCELLKEKGLLIQPDGSTGKTDSGGTVVEDQTQVVVPQDSYIFDGQNIENTQLVETTEEVATTSAEGMGETIGMVQNPDGTISFNNLHTIPQSSLDNGKAQIVILQIYPENPDIQSEIILNQEPVFDGTTAEILDSSGKVLTTGTEILPHSQIQTILIDSSGHQVSANSTHHVLDNNAHQVFDNSAHQVLENSVHQVLDNSSHQVSANIDIITDEHGIVQQEIVSAETADTSHGPDDVRVHIEVEQFNVEDGVQIADGDPDIQAPMVYSQDVTCTE